MNWDSFRIRKCHSALCGPGWRNQFSDSLGAGRSGDQIAVGMRFSAPFQTGPGTHSNGYRVFIGGKAAGANADHPPPPRAEDKGRVQLYLYSPLWPSWLVLGSTLPLSLPLHSPGSLTFTWRQNSRSVAWQCFHTERMRCPREELLLLWR